MGVGRIDKQGRERGRGRVRGREIGINGLRQEWRQARERKARKERNRQGGREAGR